MCISGLFSNDSSRLLSFIFLNQPCTFFVQLFKSHFGLFFFSVLAQPSEFANDVGILLIYICTVKWDMHERGRKPNKSLDVHYYFKRYCWRCCCFANGNVIIFLSIVLFAAPVWNISSFFFCSLAFLYLFLTFAHFLSWCRFTAFWLFLTWSDCGQQHITPDCEYYGIYCTLLYIYIPCQLVLHCGSPHAARCDWL